MENWQQYVTDTLQVKVTPNAATERVKAERLPDGQLQLRVYVTVVPENGKANAAVLKLLAKMLKLPKSALSIIQGENNREKIVRIQR